MVEKDFVALEEPRDVGVSEKDKEALKERFTIADRSEKLFQGVSLFKVDTEDKVEELELVCNEHAFDHLQVCPGRVTETLGVEDAIGKIGDIYDMSGLVAV